MTKMMTAACLVLLLAAVSARADGVELTADQQLARDIYAELIGIDTTHSTGSTTTAAHAVARRLTSAGFPASDIQILEPASAKGNLVLRVHGGTANRPLLMDIDYIRARGKDERLGVKQFHDALEFLHRLVLALST